MTSIYKQVYIFTVVICTFNSGEAKYFSYLPKRHTLTMVHKSQPQNPMYNLTNGMENKVYCILEKENRNEKICLIQYAGTAKI